MAFTLDQLRKQLSAIEPSAETYAGIGVEEVPLLKQLLKDPEAWMAARAIFALSRIANPHAISVLLESVSHPSINVRVALAESAKHLPADASNDILIKLLNDTDFGVRQLAVSAVTISNALALHDKITEIENSDPVHFLRDLARVKRREISHPILRPDLPEKLTHEHKPK
jgi:HEAT repeats